MFCISNMVPVMQLWSEQSHTLSCNALDHKADVAISFKDINVLESLTFNCLPTEYLI
jgi:hypothetical protein